MRRLSHYRCAHTHTEVQQWRERGRERERERGREKEFFLFCTVPCAQLKAGGEIFQRSETGEKGGTFLCVRWLERKKRQRQKRWLQIETTVSTAVYNLHGGFLQYHVIHFCTYRHRHTVIFGWLVPASINYCGVVNWARQEWLCVCA